MFHFSEAVMLSQQVWDQLVEAEKGKIKELENKFAAKMKAANVRWIWIPNNYFQYFSWYLIFLKLLIDPSSQ